MILETKNISFGYNGKALFSGVSLSVNAGELVVIGGPSGSGKSTLLRLLNRLNNPDQGGVFFDGTPLTDYKVTELRRQIYYLQQTPLMVEGTVKHNLIFPFDFRSSRNAMSISDEILLGHLKQLKLEDVSLYDNATELSVGQKQRVSFIRALLLEPKVLLLDEPTSALDQESRAIVEGYIERLVTDQGIAVIMVTHLDFNPRYTNARRYLLRNGILEEVI